MKKKLFFSIVILAFFSSGCMTAQSERNIYIASWNVENLFDTFDDPNKNDNEFLPQNAKMWNEERLYKKYSDLAKVINSMNNDKGPDLIGLQEIENLFVLEELVKYLNDKRKYKIVHLESLDNRGIDNAVIYDSEKFNLLEKFPIEVKINSKNPTRYIVMAKFNVMNRDTIVILVNHWPSRAGGEKKSEPNRITAGTTAKNFIDSLNLIEFQNVILMGDFNDEPSNAAVNEYLGAEYFDCTKENGSLNRTKLFNLSAKQEKENKGSYLFRGNWNMLDQIIISGNLLDKDGLMYICESFEIFKPDFMVQKEGEYKVAPLRTYIGDKYQGGYSDHFPVGAEFYIY